MATPAGAILNPATGKTAALSVMGADDGGEAKLHYTWVVASLPLGAPAPKFSANRTNAAKQEHDHLRRGGKLCPGRDHHQRLGSHDYSSSVTVVVQPMATEWPSAQPQSPWKALVRGSSASRATTSSATRFRLKRTSHGPPPGARLLRRPVYGDRSQRQRHGLGGLRVGPGQCLGDRRQPAPHGGEGGYRLPQPRDSTTAVLAVLGKDDGGEANLSYTWSVSGSRSGAPAPTFSVNGTNAAKNITATFGALRNVFLHRDDHRRRKACRSPSSVTVAVNPAFTAIMVNPSTPNSIAFQRSSFSRLGSGPVRQPRDAAAEFHVDGQFGHDHGHGPVHPSGHVGERYGHGGVRFDHGTAYVNAVNAVPTVAKAASATPGRVTG